MPHEIEYLIKGYKNFRRKYFLSNNQLFDELVKNGQKPKVLVVSCSDSRVDPSIIMDCKPGDLFVVRNVANLIPPCQDNSTYHGTSAALEFGINGLGIRHLVLLGHSKCGGINSLFENSIVSKDTSFIAKWMEIAEPAKEKTNREQADSSIEEKVHLCAKHSLVHSLANLYTFPWIKERVEQKNLFIHCWYFDIETGIIQGYSEQEHQFIELGGDNFFLQAVK